VSLGIPAQVFCNSVGLTIIHILTTFSPFMSAACFTVDQKLPLRLTRCNGKGLKIAAWILQVPRSGRNRIRLDPVLDQECDGGAQVVE
jgi:hypothetical protein